MEKLLRIKKVEKAVGSGCQTKLPGNIFISGLTSLLKLGTSQLGSENPILAHWELRQGSVPTCPSPIVAIPGGSLQERSFLFRQNCINIGYIRKLRTGETETERVRLLRTMASRLRLLIDEKKAYIAKLLERINWKLHRLILFLFPQGIYLFPPYHRSWYKNGCDQSENGQKKLRFWEVFAQHVKAFARWWAREEGIKSVCKYKRCRFQQSRRCCNMFNAKHLSDIFPLVHISDYCSLQFIPRGCKWGTFDARLVSVHMVLSLLQLVPCSVCRWQVCGDQEDVCWHSLSDVWRGQL